MESTGASLVEMTPLFDVIVSRPASLLRLCVLGLIPLESFHPR